ncbi:MAG: cytochrome d ubiquinol oxidase subunit II [Chitinophagales bacterium]|nr:cytochrome d ubiquinol oxidase subunit II [Chitinophagales bacterium]
MLSIVILFFWISILLYILLGGADFGAGILEIFVGNKNKEKVRTLTYNTIGPIWEANHMWLIISIVILFVAFPSIYTSITTYLHIPIMILLLGNLSRGMAFIFRHYDAYQDEKSQQFYNYIFMISSLITSFFLGVIAGSIVGHQIQVTSNNFLDTYIFSWLSPFSISTGILCVVVFAFLASTFLIGESETEEDKKYFRKKSLIFSISVFIWGGIALIIAKLWGTPFIENINFISWNTLSFLCSGISLLFYWKLIFSSKKWRARFAASSVIMWMLVTTALFIHPEIVTFKDQIGHSFLSSAANSLTIYYLGWALLLGSIFIIPGVVHLIASFQAKS